MNPPKTFPFRETSLHEMHGVNSSGFGNVSAQDQERVSANHQDDRDSNAYAERGMRVLWIVGKCHSHSAKRCQTADCVPITTAVVGRQSVKPSRRNLALS